MLYGIVLVIHILVSLVLIAVILLQAGRGGGLSDSFGGAAQSVFGTRGAVYLTRMTTACAVIFMSTSLTLAILSVQRGRSLMEHMKFAPAASPVPISTSTPAPAKTEASPSNPKAEEPKPAANHS